MLSEDQSGFLTERVKNEVSWRLLCKAGERQLWGLKEGIAN